MNRLWVLPLLCLAGGVALSFVTLGIDRATGFDLLPQSVTGTPSSAQQVLSLIGQSVFTLASLVLSLTLVAVQLAMGQFSPRIVRALLEDRRSQVAIGLFLGTFAFTMLGMREIDDSGPGGGTVPGVTVVTAYALAVSCIGVLLLYVHHAGQSMRVAGIIDLVGDETRGQLERVYPPERAHPPPGQDDPRILLATESGNVVHIDHAGLIAAAREADSVFEVIPVMGDFVPDGAPLLCLYAGAADRLPDGLEGMLQLDRERTHLQDPAYGVRKLVDIAERTSAEPYDDPTTTVMAIDRLHDCLRLLARREFPSGLFHDDDGELRLIQHVLDWEGYVRLAFTEVRLTGAGNPQIARRLRAALLDIREVAPAERRRPIDRELALLESAVRREYADEEDIRASMTPDPQGIGSGADLLAEDPGVRPTAASQS